MASRRQRIRRRRNHGRTTGVRRPSQIPLAAWKKTKPIRDFFAKLEALRNHLHEEPTEVIDYGTDEPTVHDETAPHVLRHSPRRQRIVYSDSEEEDEYRSPQESRMMIIDQGSTTTTEDSSCPFMDDIAIEDDHSSASNISNDSSDKDNSNSYINNLATKVNGPTVIFEDQILPEFEVDPSLILAHEPYEQEALFQFKNSLVAIRSSLKDTLGQRQFVFHVSVDPTRTLRRRF